jgi:hypothetical protein
VLSTCDCFAESESDHRLQDATCRSAGQEEHPAKQGVRSVRAETLQHSCPYHGKVACIYRCVLFAWSAYITGAPQEVANYWGGEGLTLHYILKISVYLPALYGNKMRHKWLQASFVLTSELLTNRAQLKKKQTHHVGYLKWVCLRDSISRKRIATLPPCAHTPRSNFRKAQNNVWKSVNHGYIFISLLNMRWEFSRKSHHPLYAFALLISFHFSRIHFHSYKLSNDASRTKFNASSHE